MRRQEAFRHIMGRVYRRRVFLVAAGILGFSTAGVVTAAQYPRGFFRHKWSSNTQQNIKSSAGKSVTNSVQSITNSSSSNSSTDKKVNVTVNGQNVAVPVNGSVDKVIGGTHVHVTNNGTTTTVNSYSSSSSSSSSSSVSNSSSSNVNIVSN